MALPTILAPSSAPVFLAAGHAIQEDSVFAEVQFGTGHGRSRRVRTKTERVVSVSWLLSAAQMAAVEAWFEQDLQAGALAFSARVANQDGSGLVYWAARWVDFQTEMLHYGRGRVRGSLYLYGEPSAVGPELSELAAEVSVILNSTARVTIPSELAAEISVALQAETGDQSLQAEVSVALDGTAVLFEISLAAEVPVALDGAAEPTIGVGPCAPFDVLGDTGVTMTTGDAISPLADTGETFDACRELQ